MLRLLRCHVRRYENKAVVAALVTAGGEINRALEALLASGPPTLLASALDATTPISEGEEGEGAEKGAGARQEQEEARRVMKEVPTDVLQELQTLGSLSLEEKIGRCTEAFRVSTCDTLGLPTL